MSETPVTREPQSELALKRNGWDVALGVLLVLIGVFVLGDVVLAGVISVLVLGWALLIGGAAGVVVALIRLGRGGSGAGIGITGAALSFVAGLVFVRNPEAALLALALAVGAMLVISGLIRLVSASQVPGERLNLIVTGILSLIFGLMLLNRWPETALWLLGFLIGLQLIIDGMVLLFMGRIRRVSVLTH